MSGKNIFAVFALLLFGAAVAVFFQREESRVVVQEIHDQPKINLYQYEYYRVKDDVEVSRVVGKKADLMEGGKLLLRDGVRGVRVIDNRREEGTSQSADIDISGSHGLMSGDVRATKARFFGKVAMSSGDSHFETEELHYTEDAGGVMQTKTPVRFQKKAQVVSGQGGFIYQIKTQKVEMQGGVSGTLIPKDLSEGNRKERSP